ncbi:MAG: hypothetical protein IKZ94_00765 [Lachnospiraceae bacterium]|nr:hypothetical protein [Lachnospiraceae bacterium]
MNKKISLVLFGTIIIAVVIALALAVATSSKGDDDKKEAEVPLWENISDETETVESATVEEVRNLSERNDIRISRIEENVKETGSKVEEAMNAKDGAIESIRKELESTKSGLDSAKAELDKTKENVDANKAALDAAKNGVESAKSSFEEITDKLKKELTDADDKLKKELTGADEGLKKELDATLEGVKGDIEINKSGIAKNASDIEALLGSAADKSETEELRNKVGTLEETLGALAVSYADGIETVRDGAYEAGYNSGLEQGKEQALGNLNLTHAYSYTSANCNYQVAGFYNSFIVVCAGLDWNSPPSYSVSTSRSGASVQLIASYHGQYTSNTQHRMCTVWKVSGLEVGDWIYGRGGTDPFMIMTVIGTN